MSDISTDMEVVLKDLRDKYPNESNMFNKAVNNTVTTNDIDPICSVISTGIRLILSFREVREKLQETGKENAALQIRWEKLKRFLKKDFKTAKHVSYRALDLIRKMEELEQDEKV